MRRRAADRGAALGARQQGLDAMQVKALIIWSSCNISVCSFVVQPPRSRTLCSRSAAHQEAPKV